MASEGKADFDAIGESLVRARASSSATAEDGAVPAWVPVTPPEFMRTKDQVRRVLAEFSLELADRTEFHLGYPYNLKFDTAPLIPFMQYSVNNLGDPFVTSNYGVHSRMFEIEVLYFFADLWRIPRDDFWGYTTTCGTEGNQLGVLYGREKLPEGVLYCSRDTHYSVPKAGMMFRIPTVFVKSQESGEMDYEDFDAQLAKNPDKPAIVVFNAGTTVMGAMDCVDTVLKVLKKHKTRDQFYLHCDGALAGLIVPFLEGTPEAYNVSFEKEIDSVSVSGHKMLGCPMPCGVVITRKEHMERFQRDVEYLNSKDTTITGSRNGQAPIAMWFALQKKGVEGLRHDCQKMRRVAAFLTKKFTDAGIKAHLNPMSTTVVFERPHQDVVSKWQLACAGEVAHVVVMPSVDEIKVTRFFDDYMESRKRHAADTEATAADGAAESKADDGAAAAAAAGDKGSA